VDMTRINTLICTVGTSLFAGHLAKLSNIYPDAPDNWQAIRRYCEEKNWDKLAEVMSQMAKSSIIYPDAHDNWQAIRKYFEEKNWDKLAEEMLQIDPSARICGAEINTVQETSKKHWINLENLIFLVSDTEDGQNTGKLLEKYFKKRADLKLRNVEYAVVEKLQDKVPKDFKIYGLRNLVRKIGEYVQRFGGPEFIAIDATGGYKAQIAIAVIIGQALNVPVFYKHERFSEIINFPPLPIAFDDEVFAHYSDLLSDLEKGVTFTSKELGEIDSKLRVLLTEVDVNGEMLYELNPIGQIYLTAFRIRNPKPIRLIPASNKKQPTFGDDHHYPKGFKAYVEKVWQDNEWIITANSLPYNKQKSIKGNGFFVRSEGDKYKLIGTYKSDFGAKFELHLTDSSLKALAWAADVLNQRYREM